MTISTSAGPDKNSYWAGEIVRVFTPTPFTDDTTDTPGNPTTTELKIGIVGIASTAKTYVYGTDAIIVNDGAGIFHADIDTTNFQPGRWDYEWIGIGGVQSIDDNWFMVKAPIL